MGLNRISWKQEPAATAAKTAEPLPMGLNRISWKQESYQT